MDTDIAMETKTSFIQPSCMILELQIFIGLVEFSPLQSWKLRHKNSLGPIRQFTRRSLNLRGWRIGEGGADHETVREIVRA